jgi:hypothetical protein
MWLFTELSSTSFIAERCAAVLKEFTTKQTISPIEGGHISICDTTFEPPSISRNPSGDSQSSDTWPIMSSWTNQLSDIAATCFSPSPNFLDTA